MLFRSYMRPIYCASRVKFPRERILSEVELVMVSVVYACRRFRPYLLPKPFVFLTSYTLLPQLVNGTHVSKSVMQWVAELQEFKFSFLVEESTRATLVNFLTYKKSPLLIKETIMKKPTSSSPDVDNACCFLMDPTGKHMMQHQVVLFYMILKVNW